MEKKEKKVNPLKPNKWKELKKEARILKDPFALIFYVIMIIYVLTMIIPTLWMIISTFKDRLQFRFNLFGLPDPWTFENYKNVFSKMYITITSTKTGLESIYVPELMFNGLIFSIVGVAASLCMQILVAYGCTKYKSMVGTVLHTFAIVTMILPLVGTMGATLLLYKRLGLYDKFLGIMFAHAGWGGSNFLLLCGTFKGISDDYREAAFIDGAGHFRVLLTIMIPMIRTAIVALFILGFIGAWNDYMTPMVYLPSMPTIAYGLFTFRNSTDSLVSAIPMQITGCVVVMIPIMIIFIIFRNKIMGNLALGGLKG